MVFWHRTCATATARGVPGRKNEIVAWMRLYPEQLRTYEVHDPYCFTPCRGRLGQAWLTLHMRESCLCKACPGAQCAALPFSDANSLF